MSIVVLILNFLFTFGGGSLAFMFCYPNKEKKDTLHAWCHIALATISYLALIVVIILYEDDLIEKKSILGFILLYMFIPIVYVWGLVFGGLLIFKARAVPLHLRIPLPIATNPHHDGVNVNMYQPLHQ